MRATPLFLATCLVVAGCPSTPAPEDAGSDAPADPPDAIEAPDAYVEPPRVACRPCRSSAACGEGNLCLPLGARELACGVACATDDDCAGLPVPSSCVEVFPGMPLQCQPTGGTCVTVAAGTACVSADACGGTYDRCVDGDGFGARCTTACESDADCPMRLRRCADVAGEGRVCVPDRVDPTARCAALLASGGATACGAGGSCPSGTTCHGTAPLALCLGAPPCADGTVERSVGGARLCVPTVDSPDPWNDVWADCECVLASEGSLLDEAAALALRSRCDLRFRSEDLALYPPELSNDRFRLSFTDRVHQGWLAVPPFASLVERRLDAPSTAQRLAFMAELADLEPTDVSSMGSSSFEDALDRLVLAAGATFDVTAHRAEIDGIDASVRDALVPLLDAVRDALVAREAALAGLSDSQRAAAFGEATGLFLGNVDGVRPPTSPGIQGLLLGDLDMDAIAGGAIAIAEAVEPLAALAGRTGSLVIETPAGRVAVGSPGVDRYEGAAWERVLLLVELGGNDVYRVPAGATTALDHGVSIALDLGGDDDHGYDAVPVPLDTADDGTPRPPSDGAGRVTPTMGQGPSSRSQIARQGAGRAGIGMLFDLGAGADRYASLRMSQGYGALGVGVLSDRGGVDTYVSEAGSQGAASFGLGLLEDRGSEADTYTSYATSQGFAYSRGVGVLWDEGGGDRYTAVPNDVLYWSPQIPGGSNSSFSQGVGFGRRADFGDGVFMSGGLGVLRDRAGSDEYVAAVFAQASGYWFGMGMLLDGGGDDRYDAEWYAQASDAHYAIAALVDRAGDDVYDERARRYSGVLGSGHDFSSAWFLDLAGDDTYRLVGRSGGTGNAGGFGAFVDASGTDEYAAEGAFTLGNCSIETPGDALRQRTGTYAFFLERGGTDAYTRDPMSPIANDASWTQELHPGENEHGAGVDRAGGTLGVPAFE